MSPRFLSKSTIFCHKADVQSGFCKFLQGQHWNVRSIVYLMVLFSFTAVTPAHALSPRRVALVLGTDSLKPQMIQLFLRRSYDLIRSYDSAKKYLDDVAIESRISNQVVDLYILTHGAPGSYYSGEEVTVNAIRAKGPFPNLRLVYMMTCNAATSPLDPRLSDPNDRDFSQYPEYKRRGKIFGADSLSQVWKKQGAKVVLGTKNFSLAIDYYLFIPKLGQGKTVRQAYIESIATFYGVVLLLGNGSPTIVNYINSIIPVDFAKFYRMPPWNGKLALNSDMVNRYFSKEILGDSSIVIR